MIFPWVENNSCTSHSFCKLGDASATAPGSELQTKDAQDIPELFLNLPEMISERSLSDELKLQDVADILEILGFFVQR